MMKDNSQAGKRIVLSTFGSFGDVHPYIAIALELKRRGHQPVFATTEMYREKLEALGLELHGVRPDVPSYDEPEKLSEMIAGLMDAKRGPEELLRRLILPYQREMYEDLSKAVQGADLLLTHPLPFTGPLVAQKTGIKWVSSVLAPGSFLSAYDPPVPPQMPALHKLLKLNPIFVRLLMRLANLKLEPALEPVYQLRAELGLPRGGSPLFEGQHSPTLVLALYSPLLGAPQPDWPPHAHITGFPFYDRRDRAGDAPAGAGLAPALLEFLDAGTPPIVFTLGSSAIWVAENFYQDSIAAARALGRRALLLIGDERNRPREPLPEGIAAFEYAPFSEVLPRALAVVHQGGVGTTGQALRAGVPTLIVPHAFDQHDNAARAARLGTSRTLERPRYNAASATRELKKLLDDASYATKAVAAGKVVSAEDGAAVACDLIEEVLRGN